VPCPDNSSSGSAFLPKPPLPFKEKEDFKGVTETGLNPVSASTSASACTGKASGPEKAVTKGGGYIPASEQSGLSLDITLDRRVPIHFVGVGGVGMSGLAILLCEAGYLVSGSDVAENAYTQKLVGKGATIYKGHATQQVPAGALLILSSSINPKNPEVAVALSQGLTMAHRSTLLREILKQYQTAIGITGTHGKTTITGMTGLALRAAGLDPGIVVGGKLPQLLTNAVAGAEERRYAVAELDESDGTLLQYHPTLSVIANMELDHADFYQDGLTGFLAAFKQYVAALKPGSKIFYNIDCPNTATLAAENLPEITGILLSGKQSFTGAEKQPTYHLQNLIVGAHGLYSGQVYKNGHRLGELSVGVPGEHNLFNALCAIAVGDQLGADFKPMAAALKAFIGMGRRFEILDTVNGAMLVDDYAHHPSEVLATLKAAKESISGSGGRVIAVFQPHRYTRLQALWDEFVTCFSEADELIIADVYSAHEAVIPGMTAEELAKAIQSPATIQAIPNTANGDGFDLIRERLRTIMQPGDLVISMGAGSITHLLRGWQL
jgi:UDP-N-acetylmuramate--alanine ligase